MTPLDASRHAHSLWYTEGQGVAVYVNSQYLVGIAKDSDALEVYGRSQVSFEDAFRKAQGEGCRP